MKLQQNWLKKLLKTNRNWLHQGNYMICSEAPSLDWPQMTSGEMNSRHGFHKFERIDADVIDIGKKKEEKTDSGCGCDWKKK